MSPTSVNAPPIPTPRRCSPPPRCPTRFSSETGVPDPSPQWTITRPSRMPAAPPATGTATFRRRTATATGTTPRIPVRPTSAAHPRRPRQGPPPCSVRHSSEGDRMELDPPVQQFLEVNAGELQFLNRLSTCEQRRYMRLLTDLNFLRFSSPGPAVHSVTDGSGAEI